jgi:hypothetical protein
MKNDEKTARLLRSQQCTQVHSTQLASPHDSMNGEVLRLGSRFFGCFFVRYQFQPVLTSGQPFEGDCLA